MMIEKQSVFDVSEFEPQLYDSFLFSVGSEIRSTQLFHEHFTSYSRTAAFIHNNSDPAMEGGSGGMKRDDLGLAISGGSVFVGEQYRLFRAFLAECSSLLVDVSCMTRAMMAETILYLAEYVGRGLKVTFAYLPSTFQKPEHEYPKIRSIGPANPYFSGFDFTPSAPVALVLGLGHEYGVALGIMNQFEPSRTVCFRAVGIDARFEEAVQKANLEFDFSPHPTSVIDYDVINPLQSYGQFENVAANLIPDHRVVVVPSGPKIFALIACLAAFKHLGSIAVYRIEHARTLRQGQRSNSVVTFTMANEFSDYSLRNKLVLP